MNDLVKIREMSKEKKVAIFSSGLKDLALNLQNLLVDVQSEVEISSYTTISSLHAGLRGSLIETSVVILFVANPEELKELVQLGGLLYEQQVIVVLPDMQPTTIAMAHSLRPRMVHCVENDLAELGAVLRNMLRRTLPARHREA